ncbi:MAG: hypothetical protein E7329_02255 [Clostridiales bacterium]|nr:hypothetical protein [Clostridiales bacterium]
MDTVKLYLRSMKMLLRCQMQYPVSFLLQSLAQLVMTGGEMMAVLLVIDRFEALNQWTGGDLLFFFGLMNVVFYITECFARGVTGAFPSLVRTGRLDGFLVRPRGVFTQVICYAADPRRLICIGIGALAMALGSIQSQVIWTLPKVLLLLEAIFFGYFQITGLFLIEAIFCMFSVKSVEVVNALTYGGRSCCQYPVDIYPRPLQMLFTVVAPFGLTMHVPGAYILGKPLYGWPAWSAFLCPLAGGVIFLIMYLFFRRAMRYYRSTGS